MRLSNLDKVLYPEAHFTKAHVIDYYRQVAPALLPHLAQRPVTMKRYPDGVEGEYFYEKQRPGHAPGWLRSVLVHGTERPIDYCLFDDLPSLMWAANMADLELHTFLHRAPDPSTAPPEGFLEDDMPPTCIAFDLDPGEGAGVLLCAEVGLRLRDLFREFGLDCYPKTSGSKGMQIYLPLNTPTSYDVTKPFSRAVAEALERDDPKLVTSNMRKDLRVGRVLVDWSQNDDKKTTVNVYSLRARPRPTVSTPLAWREVEAAVKAQDAALLSFEADAVLARVAKHGDLFAKVQTQRQELPAL